MFSLISGLTLPQWLAAALSSVFFGMAKTGLSGLSVIAVPVFAYVFGAKSSTGIILPLLCFADLFAVLFYRRHAEWKYIWHLVPWAAAGFGLALAADRFIVSDRGFKNLIGVCILTSLAIMFWNDVAPRFRKKAKTRDTAHPPKNRAAAGAPFFGILGGFSTMIGNSAGPIMSVFLLAAKLPKESFVGTSAWFFLILNYLKIPVQVFAWHNISPRTLVFDLFMLPSVLLGVLLGVLFVKKVSDVQYRIAVYLMTMISAVLLFL